MEDTYNRNRQVQRTYNYVHGTAAPKINTPQRKPEKPQKTSRRRIRYVKTERISPLILASWIVASAVLIITCGALLTLQGKTNNYVDEISALEAEIENLKSENNFNLARINESVDMDQLQQEAETLGMVKLTKEKIIYVEYDGSDYVRQYKNVTEASKNSSYGILGR